MAETKQEVKHTALPWFVGSYYEAGVNDGSHPDWHAPSSIPQGKCAFCGNPDLELCGEYKNENGGTFHRHRVKGGDNWHDITAENGTKVCGNYDYEEGGVCTSEADAELIVRAVNSHALLVEALEAAEKFIKERFWSETFQAFDDRGAERVGEKIRAALQAAKQERL